MPVKHRYRSPIVFEFHRAGKRGAAAYATVWLQHLIDNEETPIDIPIWTTKHGPRICQNYIMEQNFKAKEVPGLEDLEKVGRLQFRGRFKAGIDESHQAFVTDNESRETFEAWEACLAEGVREPVVDKEVPESIEVLHERSLTEGRDVLKLASPSEREKWLSKTGEDWSGAFGDDPRAYTDKKGKKLAELPPHDPVNPSSDEDHEEDYESDSSSDLGITGAHNWKPDGTARASVDTVGTGTANGTDHSMMANGTSSSRKAAKLDEKANKKSEKRKQRGLMQWKPARNVVFAADEARFGIKKLQKKMIGGLGGREPGVETETGS